MGWMLQTASKSVEWLYKYQTKYVGLMHRWRYKGQYRFITDKDVIDKEFLYIRDFTDKDVVFYG